MLEIMNYIGEIFYHMWIPILVGVCLCCASSLLGVVLIPKRLSMMGDGLSHVAFGTLSVAFALEMVDQNMRLWFSLPIVIVVAFVLISLSEAKILKGDAGIAIISSSALAIGYLVGTLTDGFSADIASYMFGSIATATMSDLVINAIVAFIFVVFFILMGNRIFAVSYDSSFARATGIKTTIYRLLLAVATGVIIVLGIDVMGTLLISSLLIFPVLTVVRFTNNFFKVLWFSVAVSILAFLIAFFSFAKFSSASGIVIVNLGFYLIASVYGLIRTSLRKNRMMPQ